MQVTRFIFYPILLLLPLLLSACFSSLPPPDNTETNTTLTTPALSLSIIAHKPYIYWTSSTAAYYELYRNTFTENIDLEPYRTRTASLGVDFTDQLSNTNITYYYWVKGCNSKGCTDFSNRVTLEGIQSSKLNDTGITWDGNYTASSGLVGTGGNNARCGKSDIPHSQDCNFGRDNYAITNRITKFGSGSDGFDFTKLDNNGEALSADATVWQCVRDNHTGLIWEVKTQDSSVHQATKTYQWGGTTALGLTSSATNKGEYYSDWNDLVNTSNGLAGGGEKLCGIDNWRLPTAVELDSITHKGKEAPAIDTQYFPNTQTDKDYWTALPYVNNPTLAWSIRFDYGYDNQMLRTNKLYVRLVSGARNTYPTATPATGQTLATYVPNAWGDNRYLDDTDKGVVTDTLTNLMWKKCSQGQTHNGTNCGGTATKHNWQDALQQANEDTTAGFDDWRLPDIKELRSLTALDRTEPSINASIFPNTVKQAYWSSTPKAVTSGGSNSVAINFTYGRDAEGARGIILPIRLIRNID